MNFNVFGSALPWSSKRSSDVGSYLKLGGQVIMRCTATATSTAAASAFYSAKTWMDNCPLCPSIIYSPDKCWKVFTFYWFLSRGSLALSCFVCPTPKCVNYAHSGLRSLGSLCWIYTFNQEILTPGTPSPLTAYLCHLVFLDEILRKATFARMNEWDHGKTLVVWVSEMPISYDLHSI